MTKRTHLPGNGFKALVSIALTYLDTLNEDNCSHACALELGVISQYSGQSNQFGQSKYL